MCSSFFFFYIMLILFKSKSCAINKSNAPNAPKNSRSKNDICFVVLVICNNTIIHIMYDANQYQHTEIQHTPTCGCVCGPGTAQPTAHTPFPSSCNSNRGWG